MTSALTTSTHRSINGRILETTKTFTQLTAAGQTDFIQTDGENHIFAVTVATIDTNVIVAIEGSIDGTNFFEIPMENTAVANLTLSANRATIGANGTYALIAKNNPLKFVRLNFISESGGTGATVDCSYRGLSIS